MRARTRVCLCQSLPLTVSKPVYHCILSPRLCILTPFSVFSSVCLFVPSTVPCCVLLKTSSEGNWSIWSHADSGENGIYAEDLRQRSKLIASPD